MKRTPLKRHRPLSPGRKGLTRSGKLRPFGVTRRKKKSKYDAYMKSPTWKKKRKEAIERAGGRCEWTEDRIERESGFPVKREWRCTAREHLTVHHKSYARFGGGELPQDLQCLCVRHHEMVEDETRPWNRNRRYA